MLEHGIGLNWYYLYKMFVVPFRGPVPHRWFVISLFSMFLLAPILKWTATVKMKIMITFILLSLLNLMKVDSEVFAIDKTANLMLYFYLGIIVSLHARGGFFMADDFYYRASLCRISILYQNSNNRDGYHDDGRYRFYIFIISQTGYIKTKFIRVMEKLYISNIPVSHVSNHSMEIYI